MTPITAPTAEQLNASRVGSKLSTIIRNWKHRRSATGDLCLPEACTRVAFLGAKGHYASVSFCVMNDDPSMMRLYSCNWKCEDEINGIYPIALCRELFREMVAAGAEAF